jgi:CelD/BcsL family acetyltransferase involved in cellulose biosynthesis
MVLLLWEIERSCELGLEAVELLGGNDQYKLAFATSQRDHVRFRAYRGLRRPWLDLRTGAGRDPC